ncbi:hypothetical protein Daus18300_013409 [Diaporthe australafricana]|uniref:Aminoglycoside phosphotransferase domain-containing protein n=1 Tax=Diaporthe australafricana TaxID=127596 RepID=A0ABR3VZ99_9PEZI
MRLSPERRSLKLRLAGVFSKALRWALLPLALAAVAIVLQHGVLRGDLASVRTGATQALHGLLQPPRSESHDANNNRVSKVGNAPRSSNQSTYAIVGWHPRTFEYDDLAKVSSIQPGRLEVVRHPELGAKPVIVKRAALPGDMKSIARETAFYHLLNGLGVTPLFLGHVTEADRIVGFLAEYVQQQQQQQQQQAEQPPGRATNDGTEACLSALRRMHARGIAHGDAHVGNCLVREDGSAVLVDFELTLETGDEEELARDLWIMSHSRRDGEGV